MEPPPLRRPDMAAGAAVETVSDISTKTPADHTALTRWSAPAMQKVLRKEKPAAGQANHAADLRTALDWLRGQGDLIETDKTVDPDLEITGLQKHMDGGCPVLFNNVKGKPRHRVVTNLFGDMK